MQHATRATRRIQSDELCPKRNVSPKLSPVRGAFLNARLRDRSIVVVVVVVVVVLLVDFWFAWSGRVPPTRIDFDRETEKPCPCLTATAVQGRGTREGCVTTTRRGERTSTVRLSHCRGATLKFPFPRFDDPVPRTIAFSLSPKSSDAWLAGFTGRSRP